MRLVIAQFDYLPDGDGLKVCQPGKTKALARVVPDATYPTMWRVVRPDGSLTDMVNQARARDMAYGRAEIATYLRLAVECQPPFYGHFRSHAAPPMRPPLPIATTNSLRRGRFIHVDKTQVFIFARNIPIPH
jgi:hypothetical protein